MNTGVILEKTEKYVRDKLEGEGSGHDWWHIQRVRATAMKLAEKENADPFVVELATLLHDIADHKFHGGDENIGSKTARHWLEKLSVDEAIIRQVCEIIRNVSFKGSGMQNPMNTIEGKVVQDADRLDALGAIGIARTFAYGGYIGSELYNPEIKPEHHATFEEYKNGSGPVINHFYEKLLLLKDRMNTPAAKELAEERHQFMETFLQRFFKEWEGH